MALNYPGYSVPQPVDLTLLDVAQSWKNGVQRGQDQRFQEQAPGLIRDSLAGGANMDLGKLGDLMGNPYTRDFGARQASDLMQRRADAADPMKQLQMEKARLDLQQAKAGPGPTAEMRNFAQAMQNPKFADFIGASGAGKAPADVQAYLFYRDEEAKAGRQPLPYLGFKSALQGQGLSVTTNPDGTVSINQGGPGMPKLTETQSKDVVYLTKGAGALPILDQYGDALTSLPESVGGKVPALGNYMKSEGFQQAEQAGKEFLAAVLRKDTGAAVTPSEEEMYGTMYLPMPGDKPAVLEQKRAARSRALTAIELGIPAPAILEMERRGVALPSKQAPADQPAAAAGNNAGWPAVGTIDGGFRYLGGDPSKRESWEQVQ